MSNLIQRGDVSARLSRFFGLKGRGQATQIAHQVVPVIIVDNLNEPEHDYLNVRQCMGSAKIAADAGNRSRLSFSNEPGSGILARFKRGLFFSASGGTFQLLVEPTPVGLPTIISGTCAFTDNRLRRITSGTSPRVIPSFAWSLGLGVSTKVITLPANGQIDIATPFILDAGCRMLLETQNTNMDIAASYEWTEENVA